MSALEDRDVPHVSELPDKLLDHIYDAATEPELWRVVLTEIADLTGSQGGILFGQSVTASRVYFDFNGRLSEECNRAYQERHMRNLWSIAMEPQPVGRIVLSDQVVPLSLLRGTLFFDEVLRPQDVAHNAMIALAAKDDFRAAFNLCRSARQGPLEENGRKFIYRLVPHMLRSIQLGFRLDAYRALQRAEFAALDRISAGIVLLDHTGRAVYVNGAARAMTASGGVLRLRNSVITAISPTHAQRLVSLIKAAVDGAPVMTMSVPHPHDGRLFTVQSVSVRSRDIDRFNAFGMRGVAAMLIIRDPAQPMDIPAAWIMDAYGLTPAEARVALAAASGFTIPETAVRLRLSPNTVKTHLRKVFAKTGTSRQAELARVLASINLLRING